MSADTNLRWSNVSWRTGTGIRVGLHTTLRNTCPNVVHDVVTFAVTAGTEYFLFVDGLQGATGVPTLDVTVTP